MELKDTISLAVAGMLALGGTLFVAIAVREWRSTWHIIYKGVQTQGMVMDNVRRPRKVGESGTPESRAPVVLYVTEKGEQRMYYSQTYTTPPAHQVGEKVDIWYLPEAPEKATLKGGDAWILPLVFGIFGAVMCLIAYPWLFQIFFRR